MRKMIAIFLIFSLLLCGCGGNDAPVSESTAEASVAEAPVSTAEEAEPVSAESPAEDPIPEDPDELAKWVFRLMAETSDSLTAYDVDVTENTTSTQLGESTTTKTSYRVRELNNEDGSVIYHRSLQADGLTEDIWFQDDIVYRSNYAGYFKAPMDQDAFLDEYGVFTKIEGVDENSYALSVEVTDSGYILSYSDISMEASMLFMDHYSKTLNEQFSDLGITVEVTAFQQSGVTELDKEGLPIRDDASITLTYNLNDIECELQVEQTIIYNQVNSDLQINVPVDDADYIEVSDITIPELFINGYTLLLSNPGLHYESATVLSIADETTQDLFLTTDVITYNMASGALTAVWDTIEMYNDEVTYTCTDEYSGGQGTLTTSQGVESYTYDDVTFLSDVSNFITYNSDSFDYGLSYTLEHLGEETVLSFELDPEYVEFAVEDYLAMYAPDYSLYEAESLDCTGAMAVSFNAQGMLTSQSLSCVCEADFGGFVLTFTLNDSGSVVDAGINVTVGSALN